MLADISSHIESTLYEEIHLSDKPLTPSSVDSSLPWSCSTDADTSDLPGTSSDSDYSQTDSIGQLLDELLDQTTANISINHYEPIQMNSAPTCVYSKTMLANVVDIVPPTGLPQAPVPVVRKNKKFAAAKVDIFGNTMAKIRKLSSVCPNCTRTLAASRLAPHLEKCLGMGRNSSRVASRRITDYIKSGAASD